MSWASPAARPSARLAASPRVMRCRATSQPFVATKTRAEYFATDQRPIILFDGVCNMCNGGVNLALDWDKEGRCRFAALQSEVGKNLLVECGRGADNISSIVLVEEGAHWVKSDAVLRIGQLLEMPIPILASLAFPVPSFIRDGVYDTVADNRYSVFGYSDSCRLGDDRFADRFVQ
mmetsp:Transcript_14136/g.45095  ORF Transcript_14136/g.45095 Transcript_14136/m.45095 type:complete len:176 (+) Transcript_14136:611-1138(+)|eukprot:CAMPEP_0182914750 /NCGR_PEP_ID=MMETSP0034_2-20130328/38731_1 /TAXON_ID=156128 /ORGANISM="Nephroselmis pyriformis, Strain CCMP717" /LENGTH=175 /DNA_ID=CAMNT_0025051533 /DNA_START=754 /DNA_END=1281 /DNA_ORIENTATION=+